VSETRLSPAHRAWLSENLLRGSPAEGLVGLLEAQAVPAEVARREAEEILGSPDFIGARRVLQEGRRHTQLVGLLRALAREGQSKLEIERRERIEPDEFFNRYYATQTPLVLSDVARRFPAFGKWTPRFFAETYGDVEIEHVVGRANDPDYDRHTARLSQRAPLRAYVERVEAAGETNDLYFVANNHNLDRPGLQPLWDDLGAADGLLDPRRRTGCASLWIGPAGTVTPLHHDTCSVLFAQLHGRKLFRLASPLDTALFDGAVAMYAAVDPEAPATYADRDVRFTTVDLQAGEILFIPVGWWHHVRALDVSISVSFSGLARPNFFDWYRPGNVT